MNQKEITLGGTPVSMIYCAATENGYETISGRSISVFVPTFGTDKDGNTIVTQPAEATIGDYLTLAMAAIVAAYGRQGQEPPVSSDYILYDATPLERNELVSAVMQLRNEWYDIPEVVKEKLSEERSNSDDDESAAPPKNE